MAAGKDDAAGLAALGLCFAKGRGCERSFDDAVSCLRRAAKLGDVVGEFAFACCLLRGDGCEKDEDTPLRLFTQVSERGLVWRERGKELAFVPNSVLEQHAMKGVKGPVCSAIRALKPKSMKVLQEAAAAGHPGAQLALGIGCLLGKGTAKSRGKAVEHLTQAAPWHVVPPLPPPERPPLSPRLVRPIATPPPRSLQAVKMTKKALTVHHKRLIKQDPSQLHTYIWV
jgi:TPR repeat protein